MTLQKRERHSKLINSVYHEDLWEIIDEVNGQGEDIEEIIDGTLLTPSSLYPALQAAGYTNGSNQITTAAITFTVCDTYGGTYVTLEDEDGISVQVVGEASRAYALPAELFSFPYAKIVAPGNQTTTDTVIVVCLRG